MKYIRRLHKVLETINYFSSQEGLQYENGNLLELNDSLNQLDRKIFNMDILAIEWELYAKDMYFGGRKFLGEKGEFNVKKDRRRMRM